MSSSAKVQHNRINDNFVIIDLEAIYKQASRHSHEHALECIFSEGMKHANKISDEDKYTELKMKYEALLTKISANEHIEHPENNDEVQKKAMSQLLGMGKIFRK